MRRPSISIELVEWELESADVWLYVSVAIAAIVLGVVVGLTL